MLSARDLCGPLVLLALLSSSRPSPPPWPSRHFFLHPPRPAFSYRAARLALHSGRWNRDGACCSCCVRATFLTTTRKKDDWNLRAPPALGAAPLCSYTKAHRSGLAHPSRANGCAVERPRCQTSGPLGEGRAPPPSVVVLVHRLATRPLARRELRAPTGRLRDGSETAPRRLPCSSRAVRTSPASKR